MQWHADIKVTETVAAALISEQFPELAPVHTTVFGVGWDNVALLVSERWVFRFPRRHIAANLVEREARILPLLAPHLPLRIPVPTYVGTPTVEYPYVWAGYKLLPGQTACRYFCTADERAALAPALGEFLRALHHIPISAETRGWAPGDEIARADVARRAPKVKEQILADAAGLDTGTVAHLVALVDELALTPASIGEPCWVHGDLYARHLVLDEAREPVGVIDWGDVHLGDSAVDLAIAWSFLPAAARPAFKQAYGPIDAATWQRAHFRAIHYGTVLVEYGLDIDDAAIRAAGEDALRFAVEE